MDEFDTRHDVNIRVVVLDTQTGEQVENTDWNLYSWLDGNATCDCNRELMFRDNEEDVGFCLGKRRYLVVEADSDVPLADFNHGYPPELLAKHGIIRTEP